MEKGLAEMVLREMETPVRAQDLDYAALLANERKWKEKYEEPQKLGGQHIILDFRALHKSIQKCYWEEYRSERKERDKKSAIVFLALAKHKRLPHYGVSKDLAILVARHIRKK